MADWITNVVFGTLIVSLLLWQIHRTSALAKALSDIDLKLAGKVSREECEREQHDCSDRLKENLKEPICRKIDEIKIARRDAWIDHARETDSIWTRFNKHTHEGLPQGSRVVIGE